MQAYRDPSREDDNYSLPDVEIFELTAREVAELDEELIFEYTKRKEFRLSTMNSNIREKMFDTMIDEQDIKAGWYYRYCFPGCIPDSEPIGPFKTYSEAKEDSQQYTEA